MTLRRAAAFLCCLAVPAVTALAQTASRPEFDAASIKPASGRPQGPSNTFLAGGRYVADASTVRGMINFAYEPLLPRQIVGGTDWIATEQYSISAKAPGNPPVETLRLMLRQLLEERFKLRAHIEKRDTDVYVLVMARTDGKLGPQLKPSTVDCSDRSETVPPADQIPTLTFEHCGFRTATRNYAGAGVAIIETGKGITTAQLAAQLGSAGRVVVDRTRLAGSYDVELRFALSTQPGATLDEPSIFVAVQEQLGLKLESETAPVDFLVIDSVERPTAN